MITPHSLNGKWPHVQLGQVVEFLDHLRKPVTAKDRKPGPYPYYGANGQQDSVADYLFDEPLVLLAEDGGHFGDPTKTIAYQVEGKCWVNNHAHVLRPTNKIDIRFLCRHLERYDVRPFTSGTTRLKLNKAKAAQIPLVLPPLSEQKRIADILDKADTLRRKRQEAIQSVRPLVMAIYDELFGQPLSNRKKWIVKSLEDVVAEGTTVSYGIVQCGEHVPDGIPYIRTSDMSDERLPPLDHFGRTHPDIAKRFRRSTVRTGDLVFANRATIGAVVALPDYLDGANLTQGTTRISPGTDVTTDYLLWTIRTPQLQAWFDRWAKGVTFREITMGQLRQTPIPIPPIELQHRFSEQLRKIQHTEQHLIDTTNQADKLFNSLVQRAFKGEL